MTDTPKPDYRLIDADGSGRLMPQQPPSLQEIFEGPDSPLGQAFAEAVAQEPMTAEAIVDDFANRGIFRTNPGEKSWLLFDTPAADSTDWDWLHSRIKGAITQATADQAEHIAALTADNARLVQVLEQAKSRAGEDHYDHVDKTGGAGRGCLACKRARERVAAIDLALAAQPADPSGLLRLVRVLGREYHYDNPALYRQDLSDAFDALDPAIKAAAERWQG